MTAVIPAFSPVCLRAMPTARRPSASPHRKRTASPSGRSGMWTPTRPRRSGCTALCPKDLPQACRLVTQAFLTCLPERELHMYRFLRLGYQRGRTSPGSHRRPGPRAVEGGAAPGERGPSAQGLPPLLRSAGGAGREIEPKNRVLPPPPPPLLHPVLREHFLIYDRTHRELLIHQPGRWAILPAEDFAPAPPGQEEVTYRRLWRRFYDTIAIRERENPRCRMTNMPKRFWGHYDGIPARRGRTPRPWTAGEGMVKKRSAWRILRALRLICRAFCLVSPGSPGRSEGSPPDPDSCSPR